ncbi:MAG: hypothetical protein JSV09_03360 [Thermoplasmata archaeon]|nr:MAG: hypothetical protein JSV09_03360 [Thermoplasmata archaeon]
MRTINSEIIDKLLNSDEPSIRYKVLTGVVGTEPESSEIKELQEQIKKSPRVEMLLSERNKDGKIPHRPYAKWYGAHWLLADLADIGYPKKDESLIPLREQIYEWLFSKEHEEKIKSIKGRIRRCASQEGNALYYLLSLGLEDGKTDELAERLSKWQWPDGGWNCDKKPDAMNSSFMESLIPLRALALHARVTGKISSKEATKKAAEVFLKRNCYRGQRDGNIIKPEFVKLHYPCYWHYDILFGLKVLTEAGYIHDARCEDALNLLESKRLLDGGFPAEKSYYRVANEKISGRSLVDWGGTSKRRMNEFVTADALFVLNKSGRLL